ncbi:MAG: MFS transporter, partial [Pseudomonadota bacterium]
FMGPLLLLTSIFFLNFISRVILAPLMPAIEKDLGIGHGEAGSFFLLISVGYFITLLGSGVISSRLTHRRTIILSSIVLGLTLIGISCLKSLWGIRFGLLLLGMSAGIYLPSGIATITSLVNPRHWGKALAVHELAPNLGFVGAPLATEILMVWFSWPAILGLFGCASVAVGLSYGRFGKGGEFKGESLNPGAFKVILSQRDFWIMMCLFSMGIGASLGIFTMLPLYLIAERGIDKNWANTLIGLSRLSGLVMAFLAGWVTDRIGPKPTMASVFFLTGIVTVLLGVITDSWIVFIVFMQPMLAVGFFPAGFAAISRIGPPNTRNVAVSLTLPFAFILGGGVIPMGIGFMGDMGSFDLGIVCAGALIFMGFILSLFLRLPRQP